MSLNIHKDDLLMAGEKIGFEKGIAAGISRGRSEGIAQGFFDGSRQKALETAKLMKAERCEVPFIQRMTGLSKHEIDNL